MKTSYVMLVGLMGCVDAADEATDLGEATAYEQQEMLVGYDQTTKLAFRDDAASLAALRATGSDFIPGRDVDVDDSGPFRTDIVFGSDDRVQVTPTTGYPVRARCRLAVSWPNGDRGFCTGYLISDRHVFTAGHCVHRIEHGGWATSIDATPGEDGSVKPFGHATSMKIRSVTAWTQSENDDFDYALITLDSPIGNVVGWYGMFAFNDGALAEQPAATIAGYPGDKPTGTQWTASGNVLEFSDHRLFYEIDTAGGDSGAGIGHVVNGAHAVIGTHHGLGKAPSGVEIGAGARLTLARLSEIQGWIAADE